MRYYGEHAKEASQLRSYFDTSMMFSIDLSIVLLSSSFKEKIYVIVSILACAEKEKRRGMAKLHIRTGSQSARVISPDMPLHVTIQI